MIDAQYQGSGTVLIIDANGNPVRLNQNQVVSLTDAQWATLDGDQKRNFIPLSRERVVDSVQKKWRSDFTQVNAIDPTSATRRWDVQAAPGGVAPALGAGLLTFGMGVVAGEEAWILSRETFTIPCKYKVAIALSQRIANQEFRVEFVSVDPLTGTPYPDGDARAHRVGWYFGGADLITQGRIERINGGQVVLDAAVTTITTLLAPVAQVMELVAENDAVRAYQHALNSSAAKGAPVFREDNIPDPNAVYKLRIRGRNTAVPASNTTVTLSFATVLDYNELQAQLMAGDGQADAASSVPVQITAQATTVGVSSTDIAMVYLLGTASSTNLAASGTYTETGVNVQPTSGRHYNRRRVIVAHTAGSTPGHLVIEASNDNTTYREQFRIPIPSDGNHRTFEFPVQMEYMRTKFINGGTAQTAFYIRSESVPFDGAAPLDVHKNVQFIVNTVAQAAGATVNGATLDLGVNSPVNLHRAHAFADQPGTLNVQQSRDGTIWRTTMSAAVVANTPTVLEDKVLMRYVRVQYVNGATIQTTFELEEALIY